MNMEKIYMHKEFLQRALTFEELKEELGDKFEEYMYKSNIELLNKLDKIKEYAENCLENLKDQDDYIDESINVVALLRMIHKNYLELLEENK